MSAFVSSDGGLLDRNSVVKSTASSSLGDGCTDCTEEQLLVEALSIPVLALFGLSAGIWGSVVADERIEEWDALEVGDRFDLPLVFRRCHERLALPRDSSCAEALGEFRDLPMRLLSSGLSMSNTKGFVPFVTGVTPSRCHAVTLAHCHIDTKVCRKNK